MTKAFVCDRTLTEIRQNGGTLTEKKVKKKARLETYSISENILISTNEKGREFRTEKKHSRAKIDMATTNLNMRDPVIYGYSIRPFLLKQEISGVFILCTTGLMELKTLSKKSHTQFVHLNLKDHRLLYDWYMDS